MSCWRKRGKFTKVQFQGALFQGIRSQFLVTDLFGKGGLIFPLLTLTQTNLSLQSGKIARRMSRAMLSSYYHFGSVYRAHSRPFFEDHQDFWAFRCITGRCDCKWCIQYHPFFEWTLFSKTTSEQTKRRRENDSRAAAINAQTISNPNSVSNPRLMTGQSQAATGVWLDKIPPHI